MFETLIAVAILAKIKRFRLRYIFSEWTVYPVLLAQAVLIFFEISAIAGNYYYTRFSKEIQVAIILSYFFAMLKYKLYKPALIGCAFAMTGTLFNHFVITQNGGNMPVFPTLSYITRLVRPQVFSGDIAGVHILAGDSAKYWYLADYIDLGYSVLSPGDILIHIYTFLMLYYLIKIIDWKHRERDMSSKQEG